MLRTSQFLLCLFLTLYAAPLTFAANGADLANHPVYAKYQFGREGKVADMGTQPIAVPLGVVGETMQRDRILKKALAARGWEFRGHSFLKGPDINFFFQRGDLDLAMAGDFPTITLAASHDIMVVGLAKQGFSALLAKNAHRVDQLKGKRVGVALNTTAHHCLLVALESAGLKEADITLVPLENSGMIEALEQGRVDAFACWEPTISTALRLHPELTVLQRVLTSNYFYLSKEFVQNNPEIAELLVAAYIRSLRWLRAKDANLMQAVGWEIAACERLLGKPSNLSPAEVAKITVNDLLRVAHHPVIPRQGLETNGAIRRAFAFLQKQDMLPPSTSWERIVASFNWTLIDKIQADPKKYQLLQFDYEK